MKTKYIFVTGGVASSLGKGIISSSIGRLMMSRGFKITIQKFDPYINIDSGTLNPNEHGECYVTTDGHEADLDLGHYERFLGIQMHKANNITTGRIYKAVIEKERHGTYLGHTIQVVPHITDEIKRNIRHWEELNEDERPDMVIVEIGGTVGDIESLPYMESIRQLKWELGQDAVSVHLTYIPYLAAAGELKTKPTQHSVQKLQSYGIQPDILVLRTEHELSRGLKAKTALFCNVAENAVFQSIDAPSIYQVPILLQQQGLDSILLLKMRLNPDEFPSDLKAWNAFLAKREASHEEVHVGLVGKYDLQDAYKSIHEATSHAATYNGRKLKMQFINSEEITSQNVEEKLKGMDAIIIGPGFGQRGIEGKIIAANFTRTHDIPTLGICLGMQCMVIEFARSVIGLQEANSRELNPDTPHPVIDMMEEQKNIVNMGGTMRLGSYRCEVQHGSKAEQVYGSQVISERHRHRYEFNNTYKKAFEVNGMQCSGINPENDLVEIVEIPQNRFYIGVQFHPEYSSSVLHPHPLFMSLITTSINKNN
ncbi:MAG: CTP synthase [Bacteroidaceae bacterium]|nr:CTP synthase [Bacteroidaceae bacterium]